uniref:Polycystin cation channel PKD1/PKD2 domain-containing protein n=1 Tax=Romanomermis culicivorax TaxID=13658 RepID=A0A915JWP5_ROMCU
MILKFGVGSTRNPKVRWDQDLPFCTTQNTCYIPVVLQNFSVRCSANSHIVYEESGNFFVNWTTSDQLFSKNSFSDEDSGLQSRTEYQYKSAYDLNNILTTGLTDFFSGGGYVVKLIGPVSVLQEKMTYLQQQGWIDDRTRAVMVEFTVYDANINVFSVNKIVSEFPPYGSVISWAAFQPLRLLPFGNQYVSLEIICLILDRTHGNTIVSFQYVQLLDFLYNIGLSFCVFATMLKLITLLRFNRRISVLQSTLARCKKDLVNYFVVFGILFAAFSQSFFFILNTKLTDYKNFMTAACSIFTVLLGKGQFDVLLASSPLIPPLFVAFFVSMVIFMVNIFITIILTAFIEIKHDSARQNNEYEVVQFTIRKLRAMMGMRPTPDQKIFCDNENASLGTLTLIERKMNLSQTLCKICYYRQNILFYCTTANADV